MSFLVLSLLVAFVAAEKEVEDNALHLTGKGWHEHVLNSTDVWAVALLERDSVCGEACLKIRQTLHDVDVKGQGIFHLGYANAHDTITALDGSDIAVKDVFNLSTIPALVIFTSGQKRLEYSLRIDTKTAGQFLLSGSRTLFESMKQFLPSSSESVKPKYVGDFLIKDAPLLPRVLLLSKGNAGSLSGVWKAACNSFVSRAVFGHGSLEAEGGAFAAAFGVEAGSINGTSVVLVSSGGPHDVPQSARGAVPEKNALRWTRFPSNGPMTFPALKQWLDKTLPVTPPVPQLRNQAAFNTHCGEAAGGGVCFIALLNGGAEEQAADNNDAPLAVFRRVSALNLIRADNSGLGRGGEYRATRLPTTFSWLDAEQQQDFAAAFHQSAPTVVALNPRKKLFAPMPGSFSEGNVRLFVEAMMEESNPAKVNQRAEKGRSMDRARDDDVETLESTFKRIQEDVSTLIRLEPVEGKGLPALRTELSREDLEAALSGIKGGKAKKASPKVKLEL